MKKIFIVLGCIAILFGVVTAPQQMFSAVREPGQSGYSLIVPCSGDTLKGSGESECDFEDFMFLIARVIDLALYVAVVLAVISFIYAGYLLLFSGGSEDKLAHAKHIFTSVVIGLVLAYGAWVVVRFVVQSLGVRPDEGYTLIDGIE